MPDPHGKSLLKCDPHLPTQRWACVSYTENRTHDTSDRNCVTSDMNKVIKESTIASVCFSLSLSPLSRPPPHSPAMDQQKLTQLPTMKKTPRTHMSSILFLSDLLSISLSGS